jgi:hypothetical protein
MERLFLSRNLETQRTRVVERLDSGGWQLAAVCTPGGQGAPRYDCVGG